LSSRADADFALDDDLVIVEAVYRDRSRKMGIDVEAEIVWAYRFENGRTRRWEMFMSRDAALRAAGSEMSNSPLDG
jgi:ketosteroid isomerase-like protein